jgi:hypothetical protein
MKQIVFISFLIIFIFSSHSVSYAQQQMRTLADSSSPLGVYGSLDVRGTQLADGIGMLIGGRGGLIINNQFVIGAAGYGMPGTKMIRDFSPPNDPGPHYYTGGYGGLYFGHIANPYNLVHFSANAFVGMGGLTYTDYNYEDYRYLNDRPRRPSKMIFVFEPQVALNLNVTSFFKISLGVSYRIVPDASLKYNTTPILNQNDFNGFSTNLSFKFGRFISNSTF